MYTPVDNQLGIQPIAYSSPVQNHPLGKTTRAYDPVYGEGEFIYLLGVASTVVGSLVIWGGATGSPPSAVPTLQTTLAPTTTLQGKACAVAMSANVAAQYGWYQIEGNAVVAENGTFTGAGVKIYTQATGVVSTTAATGQEVVNATLVVADGQPSAGLGVAYINRPFLQGAIT